MKRMTAIVIAMVMISSCKAKTSNGTEVRLATRDITFESAWLACDMDTTEPSETDTKAIVAKCMESRLVETASATRDKNNIISLHVTGAKPLFYALATDQINLISQTGKTLISDCRLPDTDLPIVTLYEIKTTDKAFTTISKKIADFLVSLNKFSEYQPKIVTFRPFAGFIVTFTSPKIRIEFGEKDLSKKVALIPSLVQKTASATGFPAKVILVDSKEGAWASISRDRTGHRRRR